MAEGGDGGGRLFWQHGRLRTSVAFEEGYDYMQVSRGLQLQSLWNPYCSCKLTRVLQRGHSKPPGTALQVEYMERQQREKESRQAAAAAAEPTGSGSGAKL